eukprot:Hpha_TRINITY_DN16021_c0_g1::TRINITY_DN16021_c0_g1_i1::g.120984::m.120984/K06269/PPP1C; serine/threonine-protein phosphatase PP1 catalytic subunit
MAAITVDVDTIIEKLLSVKGKHSLTVSSLTLPEVEWLAAQAKEAFMNQPVLLEVKAPLQVVGDIHGHYEDLLRIFDFCGYPPQSGLRNLSTAFPGELAKRVSPLRFSKGF